MGIAYHEQLHPAERSVVATILAQRRINRIQQVGPDHRYLIDYEQVERPDDLYLLLAQPTTFFGHLILIDKLLDIGQIGAERQLKKRMDGHTAGIDGSHTGRRKYHTTFGCILNYIPKKSSFSCTGTAGKEQGDICTGDVILRQFKKTVFLQLLLNFGFHISELCQTHIALFGQSLVESESLIQSMAGMTFPRHLKVVPHELLVIGMHAVLNYGLGALGRRLAAKVGYALLGNDYIDAMLVMINMCTHGNNGAYLASLDLRGAAEYRDKGVTGKVG